MRKRQDCYDKPPNCCLRSKLSLRKRRAKEFFEFCSPRTGTLATQASDEVATTNHQMALSHPRTPWIIVRLIDNSVIGKLKKQ